MGRRSLLIVVAVGTLAVAAGVALYLAPGRWSRLHAPAPNVLLVTIDTLRADRLGCYGYEKAQTPHLDRLAAEGALFENAFCDVTWTTPSLASVMTGQYATAHGVKSSLQRLGEDEITVAEVLQGHGYATGAVIGSFPASSVFGLGQGFQTVDEDFTTPTINTGQPEVRHVPLQFFDDPNKQRDFLNRKSQGDAYRPDDQVTDAAVRWLAAREGQRFFLWVHYFGPHEKTDLRIPYVERVARPIAAYDGDVAVSDREVGRLLDWLRRKGVLDDTLVVLHADHGQSLGERFYLGHGRYLYDEQLRIPLILRYPRRVPAGARLRALARNIDIFPTVLEAVGVETGTRMDGRSLWAGLGSEAADPAAETYCETYLPATGLFAERVTHDGKEETVGVRRVGLRTPEWMFVVTEAWPLLYLTDPPPIDDELRAMVAAEELYNMAGDAGQTMNLAHRDAQTADALRARLRAYLDAEHAPAERRELDPASRERLRSLGYIE